MMLLLLCQQVGASCLAALAVLGFLIPFNALYLGRKAMRLQVLVSVFPPKDRHLNVGSLNTENETDLECNNEKDTVASYKCSTVCYSRTEELYMYKPPFLTQKIKQKGALFQHRILNK